MEDWSLIPRLEELMLLHNQSKWTDEDWKDIVYILMNFELKLFFIRYSVSVNTTPVNPPGHHWN